MAISATPRRARRMRAEAPRLHLGASAQPRGRRPGAKLSNPRRSPQATRFRIWRHRLWPPPNESVLDQDPTVRGRRSRLRGLRDERPTEADLLNAYERLVKGPGRVSGLGPAFSTKIIYFAGYRRGAGGLQPFILDKVVDFHHGSTPYAVPAPPAEVADGVLGSADVNAYLLDLHAESPALIRVWLDRPTTTRLIDPDCDPDNYAAYHLSGGSLTDWLDVIVHYQEAAPVHLLNS
jgi:hypothetical protein